MADILLGLDIGTQSIKAVQVDRGRKVKTLLSAGTIATPSQAFVKDSSGDNQILGLSINKLIHDMKVSTTNVSVSLPSLRVITRVIELPMMTDSELSTSIQWEAEQFIPLPLAKVKIDYAVIDRNDTTTKMKVLLVAAPLTLIEKYMNIVEVAGLEPVALETEILAAARSVVSSYQSLAHVLVLTVGATTTEIGLLYNKTPIYTRSVPIGGNTLTRAIAQELNFDLVQAEEYKKTYGLEEDKLEGAIARTLSPFMTQIFDEIEKTVAYFKEQYSGEELTSIVVCGGGAKLPGLIPAIAKHLGLDIQICNPFTNLSVDPSMLPTLTPDAVTYTISIGLALKDIS